MKGELERLEEELSKVWAEAEVYAAEADTTVERIFGKLIAVLEGKNND